MKIIDPSFMRFLNQIIACRFHAELESCPGLRATLSLCSFTWMRELCCCLPPSCDLTLGKGVPSSATGKKLIHCNRAVHLELLAAV